MQLYSVHFTTKQMVSTFDVTGKKTGEYSTDYPQVIHALPLSTAQTYKKFGNWRVEPYYADVSKRPTESRKRNFERRGTVPSGKSKPVSAKNAPSGKSAVQSAAATGNLAAAINGEQ